MNLFDDIINKRAKLKAEQAFTDALDRLGYPYELLGGGLNEQELLLKYKAELERASIEGYFPVLAPYEPDLFKLIAGGIADVSGASEAFEPTGGEQLFSKRFSENALAAEDRADFDEDEEALASKLIGENFSALNAFSLLYTEFTHSFRMSALIKLPTDKPWEAALLLPFGGWNECPAPHDMAAMLKVWHEKYGALPAVFSGDALEIYLPRPLDGSSAQSAAKEIIAFSGCSHPFINEETKAFDAFCSSLIGKSVLHFWWD